MINVQKQLQRDYNQIRNAPGAGGEDIRIRWKEVTLDPDHDPNLESSPRNTSRECEDTVRGFVYQRSLHNEVYQRFASVKVGDIVIHIPSDYDFTEKSDVSFHVKGVTYRQKATGDCPNETIQTPSDTETGIQVLHLSRHVQRHEP